MFNKPRLLTPGPTPLPERVRLALAQDMIHHRKPGFKKILLETETMLQKLFGTEQPVLPLSCSGTGAMTAAVHGLFLPGETVIVVNGGKFGERWSKIAAVRGLKVVEIDVAWGQAVTPAQVEQALREHPEAKGVFMQVCETSTAAQHPVEAIARLTRTREVLLVADGISAVGISPCPMDAWGIDCLLTGSQKGLMVPPGMALMALSARAWKRAESIPVSCFYFNLAGERDNLLKGQGLFTSPVNLIVGLHESCPCCSKKAASTPCTASSGRSPAWSVPGRWRWICPCSRPRITHGASPASCCPPGWTATSSSRWRPTNAASYSRGDKIIIRAAWSASGTWAGWTGPTRWRDCTLWRTVCAPPAASARRAIIWKRHFPHIIAPLTLSRDELFLM